MPDYLPLCAFRQELLPVACRSCAWWQTAGNGPKDADVAGEKRHQWMVALEPTWGSTGLLLAGNGSAAGADSAGRSAAPVVVASINYAPAAALPRFRDLPFAPLPAGAVLLFCLWSEEDGGRSRARRLLHKALAQLKERDLEEVYAVATLTAGPESTDRCNFFSLRFLDANGFEQVADNGQLFLMRADLRGLMSLITQAEAAVRRLLHSDPTPSPAAWTRRGGS